MATQHDSAAAPDTAAGGRSPMHVHHLVPILNVSDIVASFAWFARLGWSQKWDWSSVPGGPPTFGAVGAGEQVGIFLCLNGQGGRGRDGGVGGDSQGMWISLFVDDVDVIHTACTLADLEVMQAPRGEPWGIREMLVRHPDGHVFRIGSSSHAHAH